MSKVVNVKTQEEWDFVTTKMNLIWYVPFEKLSHPKGQVCIHIASLGHSYVDWAKKHGYQVISFEEWCKENGHIPKVEIFPGIFVGDVVVSLTYHASSMRIEGSIHLVNSKSSKNSLYYNSIGGEILCSTTKSSWRLATPLEAEAFRNGITNINNMKKEEITPKFEVGKWYKINRAWWAKNLTYSNNKIHFTEHISSTNFYYGTSSTIDYTPSIDSDFFILMSDLSEIQQYLPKGHVDKQPVDLIGRYVKALEDAPYAGSVKEGEYALIVRENSSEYVVDFPSHKSYFIRKTCIPSSRIELMPVGFEPEAEVKEEWIPKVEDWVTMIKDYGKLKKGTTAKIKENQRDNCWWLDLSWGAAPFSSMFRKATQAEIDAVNKPVKLKTEEKWQVGGYVRLIIDYKNYSKGAICKIKNYCSNNYGRAIIEIEDGSLLWEDTECEWVGMQKPVEYPVWNSYQKDDFHYITGIDSYCKTSDECYQKYEVIKTTEPIILKKQTKINYLNV